MGVQCPRSGQGECSWVGRGSRSRLGHDHGHVRGVHGRGGGRRRAPVGGSDQVARPEDSVVRRRSLAVAGYVVLRATTESSKVGPFLLSPAIRPSSPSTPKDGSRLCFPAGASLRPPAKVCPIRSSWSPSRWRLRNSESPGPHHSRWAKAHLWRLRSLRPMALRSKAGPWSGRPVIPPSFRWTLQGRFPRSVSETRPSRPAAKRSKQGCRWGLRPCRSRALRSMDRIRSWSEGRSSSRRHPGRRTAGSLPTESSHGVRVTRVWHGSMTVGVYRLSDLAPAR